MIIPVTPVTFICIWKANLNNIMVPVWQRILCTQLGRCTHAHAYLEPLDQHPTAKIFRLATSLLLIFCKRPLHNSLIPSSSLFCKRKKKKKITHSILDLSCSHSPSVRHESRVVRPMIPRLLPSYGSCALPWSRSVSPCWLFGGHVCVVAGYFGWIWVGERWRIALHGCWLGFRVLTCGFDVRVGGRRLSRCVLGVGDCWGCALHYDVYWVTAWAELQRGIQQSHHDFWWLIHSTR